MPFLFCFVVVSFSFVFFFFSMWVLGIKLHVYGSTLLMKITSEPSCLFVCFLETGSLGLK